MVTRIPSTKTLARPFAGYAPGRPVPLIQRPRIVTSTEGSTAEPTTVAQLPARPRLRDVLARVTVSLAIAVVAPATLFWLMLVSFNVTIAVIAALAWTVGAMCWRWATKRPVSGLLLLILGVMTVKTAFTLLPFGVFWYDRLPAGEDREIFGVPSEAVSGAPKRLQR